jgi:nucleoside-diphosphate-sugar epimerase
METSTVLVTGATGFIGAHLLRLLIEMGVDRVVAGDIEGTTKHLEGILNKVEVVRTDVCSFSSVLRLVSGCKPRVIYHLAAVSAPGCDVDPETGIRTNAIGTYHILEAARLLDVEQVIFASSIRIFSAAPGGDPELHDYSLARPETIYGAATLFAENIGLVYRTQYGFDYRGLRLPVVVGPGATTRGLLEYFNAVIASSVNDMPYTIYVAPYTRIPVMHVEDAARALFELAQAPLAQIRTVNYIVLGPTPPPTAQELVSAINLKIPTARINFEVNHQLQQIIKAVLPQRFDDRYAREEWGWNYRYDVLNIVDDFLADVKRHASLAGRLSSTHS